MDPALVSSVRTLDGQLKRTEDAIQNLEKQNLEVKMALERARQVRDQSAAARDSVMQALAAATAARRHRQAKLEEARRRNAEVSAAIKEVQGRCNDLRAARNAVARGFFDQGVAPAQAAGAEAAPTAALQLQQAGAPSFGDGLELPDCVATKGQGPFGGAKVTPVASVSLGLSAVAGSVDETGAGVGDADSSRHTGSVDQSSFEP